MALAESIVSARRARSVPLVLGAVALCGCGTFGPRSITAGRGAYAEVINRTEDEQLLSVLVRQRYGETVGMMSVASVTASLRFRAEAGTNIGIGDSSDYAGNLVPLSAGVAYEENPTISYVPLSGEDFIRRLLSPILVEEWLLIEATIEHAGLLFALTVHHMNGLRNPLFRDASPSPGLQRVIELYDRFQQVGVLDIVQARGTDGEITYFWDIHGYQQAYGDSVREFLDLLGIEVKPDGPPILLPIRMALGGSHAALHVQLRSAYDVLRAATAGVEIPAPHLEAGIVEPVTVRLPGGKPFLVVRSSEERPETATVRIRFHDWWYYIDARDAQSKQAFQFLRTFLGMRLADPAKAHGGPVITVPAN